MAAASSNSKPSGGSSGGNSLGGLAKSGLVYSIGMERFALRAQQAVAAARPLIQTMQQLTAVSDRLSDATGKAIKLPAGNLQATTTGLQSVQRESQGVISRFGSLVGGASLLAAKLVGVVSVLALFSRAQSVLTGTGTGTANAMGLAATATGVLGGQIGPVAGLTNMFVSAMKMLPMQLGTFGSKALAAGLALGVMSGGIGPISAGLSLISVGLRGIPGPLGKVISGFGAFIASLGLAKIAVAAFSAALIATAPGLTFGVKLAAQAEQSQIAFEVMLGSAEKAKSLLGQIRTFANSTPFGKSELIDASRALIAYGESATSVVPLLRRLGDVSSGLQIPIGELADIYGKARTQGRLFAQDMNQLTGRGIALYKLLAEQFGTTDDAIKQMVSDGKVQFANLEQAFISMSSAGGQFYGMTEKQSKSLAGRWSTFKDQVLDSLQSVGEEMVKTGSLQRSMAAGGSLIQSLTPILTTFASVVGYGGKALASLVEIMAGAALWTKAVVEAVSGASFALKLLGGVAIVATASLLSMVAAQKALAVAQMAVLAMSGPKGWAAIAVGIGVATAGTYALATALGEAGSKAEEVTTAVEAVGVATSNVPPIRVIDQRQLDRYKEIKDTVDKYGSSLTKLQAELREIDRLAPNPKFEQAWRTQAFENATGIVSQIRAVSDEIDVLSRKSTVGGQKLRDMLAMGVPPEMVNQLRQLQQQRDSLQEQGNLWKQASSAADKDRQKRDAARKEMQQLRESVDPAAKLRAELKRSQDLLKLAGNNYENRAAVETFQKNAVKSFMKEINGEAKPFQNNQGVQARTSEAISAIVAATTARTQTKAEELLSDILAQAEKSDTALDKRMVELIKAQITPAVFTIGRG